MIKYLKSNAPYFRRMMVIAIPIMIQNGVTNFVNMLDNIMVGRIGTLEMTGVSIVNQLIFVFNLCIFGAMSGAGIFTAQFFGKKDNTGIKNTIQYKLVSALILTVIGVLVFIFLGNALIASYIREDTDPNDILFVTEYCKDYLQIMLIGMLPFALSQAYAGTLRETTDRVVPMVATVTAVLVNLVFNYVLIFGKFGAPALGVSGAAIATVISRFVEFGILFIWTHTHLKKYPFFRGVFTSTTITMQQIKKITLVSLPLMMNEALWSAGMAFLNQCYSTRGLEVMASMNIASTINNVFSVALIAFGNSIGIILSQMLGAGKKEEAKKASNSLLIFAVVVVCFFGIAMAAFSGVFPKIYNTEEEIRHLATQLIMVIAAFMPVHSFVNACYFTLRSGGKTFITFLFDSGYVWTVSVPIAFCLSRFTAVPILSLFIAVSAADLIKCVVGYIFMHKGVWLNTIVE